MREVYIVSLSTKYYKLYVEEYIMSNLLKNAVKVAVEKKSIAEKLIVEGKVNNVWLNPDQLWEKFLKETMHGREESVEHIENHAVAWLDVDGEMVFREGYSESDLVGLPYVYYVNDDALWMFNVGKHYGCNKHYFTGCKMIKKQVKSLKLSFKEKFKRFPHSVVAYFKNDDTNREFEKILVSKQDLWYTNHQSYNLVVGGGGTGGWVPSKETRLKISNSNKGKSPTEETRLNMRNARTGFRHTEETRLKMRNARTGFRHTEETKDKMRGEKNSFFGKHHTKETKDKIRENSPKSKKTLEFHTIGNKPVFVNDYCSRRLAQEKCGIQFCSYYVTKGLGGQDGKIFVYCDNQRITEHNGTYDLKPLYFVFNSNGSVYGSYWTKQQISKDWDKPKKFVTNCTRSVDTQDYHFRTFDNVEQVGDTYVMKDWKPLSLPLFN